MGRVQFAQLSLAGCVMSFTPKERERIQAAIAARRPAVGTCPLCGYRTWSLQDGFVIPILQESAASLDLTGPAIPSVVITCGNCGNSQFLNVIVLGLRDMLERERSEG